MNSVAHTILSGTVLINNGTTCSMVGKNLTMFPGEIEQVAEHFLTYQNFPKVASTLRSINLSENRIKELPKIVADFKKLSILNLEKNQIVHMDEGWGRLTRLTHLKLSFNRIAAIPASFHSLTALR